MACTTRPWSFQGLPVAPTFSTNRFAASCARRLASSRAGDGPVIPITAEAAEAGLRMEAGEERFVRDQVGFDGADRMPATAAPDTLDVADVTIVGGGPVGLFGAFYAGLRGLKVRLFESLPELGGQLTAVYPEKFIYDVPGFPRVRAKELVSQLEEQAMQFRPEVHLSCPVVGLERRPDDGLIALSTGRGTFLTRAVVLTTGLGAFRPRKLTVPGVERWEGRHVHYWVRDLETFRNHRVLVVGGGDSAVDFALMLQPVARSVTLIHRRDRFRAYERSVQELYRSGVSVLVFHELKALEGRDGLERAVVFHNQTGEERVLEVDQVVLALGFVADSALMRQWGLAMEGDAIQVRDFRMETNLPGVYAAGDAVTYPGKLKLIATGFGEVANAVNHAAHFIDASLPSFPGHSSNRAG